MIFLHKFAISICGDQLYNQNGDEIRCNFDSEGVPIVGSLSSIKEQNNEENNFDFFTLTHDDFL